MHPPAVLAVSVVPLTVGLVLVLRLPRHPVGWLLLAQGISTALLLGLVGSPLLPASPVVDQLTAGAWIFLFLWLVLIAYLVPDGRPASRRWSRWLRVCGIGSVLFVVGAAGDRAGFRQTHAGVDPPVEWLPETLSAVIGTIGLICVVLLFFGGVACVWSRLRRATGDERLQELWLVWGALAVPVALIAGWVGEFVPGGSALFPGALLVATVAMPITIGIGILRYRLFDIELVLSRTVVYGVLSLGILLLYGSLLWLAGRLLGSGTPGGLLAVAVVAIAVHPAYTVLRRRVDRWVIGYRSEPHRALRLLAERADGAGADSLIESITDSVEQVLKAGRVRIDPPDSPTPGADRTVREDLVHRGELVGVLTVETDPGRSLSRTDRALLRDLATYAAVLVCSERRGAQLRRSRSRLVAAREEERRRLRRDLHDGIGPSLAAIVLKLGAARRRSDLPGRNALLDEVKEETKAAIDELRRLVDDLRPPAIDEVGLVAAIGQRAATLSHGVDQALVTEVDGPVPLPPLPAAVEVACFRIASEAITNVVRHAAATRCQVTITIDNGLVLTIVDNGRGVDDRTTPGVGWSSMRERAAEIGGSCFISGRPEGGVLIQAVLPLGGVDDTTTGGVADRSSERPGSGAPHPLPDGREVTV